MRFAPTTAALCALAALAIVPCTTSTPAHAQTSASAQRARELFKKSEQSYREGRLQEAVDLLTEAYRLDAKPVLLYNIARAYEGLGDTPHAIEHYRRYLDADPAAPDRGALEQRIATLERQQKERDELERQRAADTAAPPPAPKPEPPPQPDTVARSPSALPWIVAGVGALGVGAGAVLGVISSGRHDDAVAEKRAIEAGDLQSQAKTFATAANIAFIAGGALAAGGVIWGIVDVTSSKSASTSVAVGPAAIALRGRF